MGKTKQNKPSHRSSKPCLVYSSALISTFAKESYLLNSDPMLQTLSRTFFKVFFFILLSLLLFFTLQILVQGITSGWLPQKSPQTLWDNEDLGSYSRNLHSVGLRWAPEVCNLN